MNMLLHENNSSIIFFFYQKKVEGGVFWWIENIQGRMKLTPQFCKQTITCLSRSAVTKNLQFRSTDSVLKWHQEGLFILFLKLAIARKLPSSIEMFWA